MNILFAGTPGFAARHLEGLLNLGIKPSLVITQPDKPGKRGKRAVASEVKVTATQQDLPIWQPEKLDAAGLKAYQPDLLIVVAYGQILRKPVLALPTFGCINVHGSLLPRWRGAAPIQRAIEAGDEYSGICIMQMDAGLDTGAVLYTKQIPIAPDETSATLAERLVSPGVDGLALVIQQIKAGSLQPKPQPEAGVTYASKLTKEEAKIDWHQDAASIARRIRAFNPDPVCHTTLGSLRVKLYLATEAENSSQGNAGEIRSVDRTGIKVQCGSGSLTVTRLQLPLGKGSILSPQDVLNARSDLIHAGARFTQGTSD